MYALTKRSELKTATWAGGTTTQLAIYPSSAEYQKFNFDFRISYATVEVEESTFTFMPGVTRHLMILKGVLEIDHLERYKKKLEKFDIDTFSGEWPTKAKGKVMDFNLMTRGNTAGQLEAAGFSKGEERIIPLDPAQPFTGLYLLKGNLQVMYNDNNIRLDEGDFILFRVDKSESIQLNANEDCELIRAGVKMN